MSLMDPASPSSTKLYQHSLIYSKRKASIGFKFDAFLAGYHPKNIPMAEQTRNESTTDCVIITTGQPINDPMTELTRYPSNIPMTPPETLNMVDSIRNCIRISRPLPPIDIR